MAKIRVFILPTESGKICVNADNDTDAQRILNNGGIELSEETVQAVFGDQAAYASPETVRFNERDEPVFRRDTAQDALFEISDLKRQLAETDYVAIKIAEGAATAEEYADVLDLRRAWRARINELESMINKETTNED